MGYVIAGIIVLLIVAAGITVLVLNATRRQRQESIVGADENTPLGDTDQHAGKQTQAGTTVGGQDAERSGGSGGSGRPVGSGYAGTDEIGGRDREAGDHPAGGEGGVGGEAEGGRPVVPDSEQLANRKR